MFYYFRNFRFWLLVKQSVYCIIISRQNCESVGDIKRHLYSSYIWCIVTVVYSISSSKYIDKLCCLTRNVFYLKKNIVWCLLKVFVNYFLHSVSILKSCSSLLKIFFSGILLPRLVLSIAIFKLIQTCIHHGFSKIERNLLSCYLVCCV